MTAKQRKITNRQGGCREFLKGLEARAIEGNYATVQNIKGSKEKGAEEKNARFWSGRFQPPPLPQKKKKQS